MREIGSTGGTKIFKEFPSPALAFDPPKNWLVCGVSGVKDVCLQTVQSMLHRPVIGQSPHLSHFGMKIFSETISFR
jgi:hypothetical protein